LDGYGLRNKSEFSFDDVLSIVHEIDKNLGNEQYRDQPEKKRKYEINKLIGDYLRLDLKKKFYLFLRLNLYYVDILQKISKNL
jgi:hypothetical protein